jgi:transcriptional regulator of acetoin/glycerol metabolism
LPKFCEKSTRLLKEYHWPGNLRELENIIERALILYDGSNLEIDSNILQPKSKSTADTQMTLEALEKAHIEEVLAQVSGKISGANSASEILGLNPNTLYSRMKKLGIK